MFGTNASYEVIFIHLFRKIHSIFLLSLAKNKDRIMYIIVFLKKAMSITVKLLE